jgi:hypothetical protein
LWASCGRAARASLASGGCCWRAAVVQKPSHCWPAHQASCRWVCGWPARLPHVRCALGPRPSMRLLCVCVCVCTAAGICAAVVPARGVWLAAGQRRGRVA